MEQNNWQKRNGSLREIPRDDWETFFDRFSEQHANQLVNVSTDSDNLEMLTIAEDLPLQSIAGSFKPGDDDTVSIIMANDKTDMLSHNISKVRRIFLLLAEDGGHAGLMFQDADGAETIMRFTEGKQTGNRQKAAPARQQT